MPLTDEALSLLVAPMATSAGLSMDATLRAEEVQTDQQPMEGLAHDEVASIGSRTGKRVAAGVLALLALGAIATIASKTNGSRLIHGSFRGLIGASATADTPKKHCSKARRLSIAAECRTPKPGDECHDMVIFLKSKGIELQPMLYKGLSSESSFEEIQGHVHQTMPKVCAPPCSSKKSGKSSEDDEDSDALLAELGLEEDDDCDDDEDEDDGDDESDKKKKKKGHCHTAKPGESCYNSVIYVATDGVIQRPLAFHGLNMASSLHDVQIFLSENPDVLPDANCPEPCEEECHDAIEGEPCHTNIMWAMTDGINSENASVWFPGLTNKSSFVEFQWSIAMDDDASVDCPNPCADFCRTAREGEKCFEAVDWVMKFGVRDRPDSYKGLSVYSSFEEVQRHLFKNKSEASAHCPEPCQPDLPA